MGYTALPLASGDDRGVALGISADGHTAVGSSGVAGTHRPCFWVDGAGPTFISTELATGNTASADGSIIVCNSDSGGLPFRWTASGGVVHFGNAGDTPISANADASRVVGSRGNEQAAFWDATGTVTLLGYLPGHNRSRAMDISADGSVIVGQSWPSATGFSVERAFRWTAAGGMVDLGIVGSGETGSRAFGVSDDGTIVVGGLYQSSQAFRWTSAGGMVAVPAMAIATGISGDGSTTIGSAFGNDPAFTDLSFGYITPPDGLVVPTPIGFDPSDPTNIVGTYPDGVSSNGKAMVGYSYGTPTFPWLYTAAAPPTSGSPKLWLLRQPELHLIGTR